MSYLYHPSKALGLYSSHIPLVIKSVTGDEFYLISAVGSYFIVYKFSNLALIGISDRIDENILSIAGYKNTIFCGCDSKIYAFKRAKHISRYYEFDDARSWKIVLALGGDGYLVGVCENNILVIWDIASGKVHCSFLFPKEEFTVAKIIQPTQYSQKILVAAKNGKMQLINYVKNNVEKIYDLHRNITSLEETPNLDVVAIGCQDGSVIIHDIKYDGTIMKISHDVGAVTSIAFRTDIENMLIMMLGSLSGHVTMWNVEKQRQIGQARDIHQGLVSSLFCVPGKPFLITNSPDNSINVWNYERPDGTPLLLRSRSGHYLPPTAIKCWPGNLNDTQVLSAGADSNLRVIHTADERRDYSMGQAYQPHHGKREDRTTRRQYLLPGATDIALSDNRDGFWDSVALCHQGHRQVTTWSFSKRARGKFYLDYSVFRNQEFHYKSVAATRCVISICGNFLVVGYSSGHIVKFNLQSGLERGHYGTDTAHDAAISGLVVGLSVDNPVVVSAGGSVARFWHFSKHTCLSKLDTGSPVTTMVCHPEGDMVAMATETGMVLLVDLDNFTVFKRVRASMQGPVTDITFAHNYDFMIVAVGCLVKTFEYIENKLIDCFKVAKRVTKVLMSLNDKFLVTSHHDDLGLYMWRLNPRYERLKLIVLPVDYEPTDIICQPRVHFDHTDEPIDYEPGHENAAGWPEHSLNDDWSEARSMGQFSGLPLSYFSGLLNLDENRVRQERAAKGLASTAFFLPEVAESIDGLRWRDTGALDDPMGEEGSADADPQTRAAGKKKRKIAEMRDTEIVGINDMAGTLARCTADADFDACMERLMKLSPTGIDHELRMLDPVFHGNSFGPIRDFLRLLENQLRRKLCMDASGAWLNILLKHCTSCLTEPAANSERGIEGLMDEDVRDSFQDDQASTLALMRTVVTSSAMSRNTAVVIEMANYANNQH